jgi:hypothetical protein
MRRLQQQALSVATRLANGVDCFAHGTSRKNEGCCVWSGGWGSGVGGCVIRYDTYSGKGG